MIIEYEDVKNIILKAIQWEPIDGNTNDPDLVRCEIHNTLFDVKEQPCWQCWNTYESS